MFDGDYFRTIGIICVILYEIDQVDDVKVWGYIQHIRCSENIYWIKSCIDEDCYLFFNS